MFELSISNCCEIDVCQNIDGIKKIVYEKGFITAADVSKILQPIIKVPDNWKNIGWGEELIDFDIFHEMNMDMTFTIWFPDPKPMVTEETKEKLLEFDSVHRPSHYTEGRKYEPRKVIADWELNFNLGNAVKYISRAGRKDDAVEDLRKAIQCIEFEIEELVGDNWLRKFPKNMSKKGESE